MPLTWTGALAWPLIVLAVHGIMIPWRRKWRLASRVTLVSLGLAVVWILWAAVDISRFIGTRHTSSGEDFVDSLIVFAVFSWVHLILLGVALCICLPFDRWKHNR